VSSHGVDADLPDHDIYPGVAGLPLDQMPDDASLYRPDASLDIFSFPKGARSGIFFHDIFQHIDFQEKSQATVRQLVVQKMQDYGFDNMWLTPVLDAVVKVLNTNLSADGQKFTLADIPMSDRINEMEFYFPLNPISPPTLQRLFRENREPGLPAEYPDRMGNLDFSAAVGFMKGYIDMVFRHAEKFYLVDWKSNYLGSGAAHYTVEHLNKTMVENFYILQYHLYTLALYQYLKWRHPDFKYETDFGGVFYIFIRGVDDTPGAKSGILWDRPGLNLIKALGEVLIPGFNSTAELS
jgi:exodeoxyribonuclease V beta subunit